MIPLHLTPVLVYKGLTLVLNRPSRMDTDRMISGCAGDYFNNILAPLNRYHCDIWGAAEFNTTKILPSTKLTVLLGQESVTPFKSGDIRVIRGSPFKYGDHLFLPTFAPQEAFDRKDYENPANEENEKEDEDSTNKDGAKTQRKNFRFWLYNDIRKALRLITYGIKIYPKVNYYIYKTASEICKVLRNYRGYNLVIDIETDKDLNQTCFSFLFYKGDLLDPNTELTVYTVPVKRWTQKFAYTVQELSQIFHALSIAFTRNRVIGHNLQFDVFVKALKYNVSFPKDMFCTMIAHHRNHMEVEKSLAHVISLYTDLPFHKDEGIFDPKSEQQEHQLWLYNAKDVVSTLFVYLGMQEDLVKRNTLESAVQGCASQRVYMGMQFQGMKVSKINLETKITSLSKRWENLQKILNLLVGFNLNPRSSQQVGDYLFNRLKLPEPKYDLTGEENLQKLYIKSGAPSIRVILEMRGTGVLNSKLQKTLLWKDQRLTTSYKIAGSDMHRLGSSKLLRFKGGFKGWGTNVQNYHKSIRSIVIPDDGKVLWKLDQGGADAKITAYLCAPDSKLRALFEQNIKPYIYVAMHLVPDYWCSMLGVQDINEYLYTPIHKLKSLSHWADLAKIIQDSENHPEPQFQYYKMSKTMCLSLNYNAAWPMYQVIALKKSDGAMRLTDTVAQVHWNLYRNTLFTELTLWHEDTKQRCYNNNRTLTNLFGYPRQFSAHWNQQLWNILYAFVPQSTVACITHHAAIAIQNRIDSKDPLFDGTDLLHNEHDALMGQSPKDVALEVIKEAKKYMQPQLKNIRGEQFQMGAGVSLGEDWGHMKEIKL